MRKVFLLLLLTFVLVESCKRLDIQSFSEQPTYDRVIQEISETKAAIRGESDNFTVSINDARCYLAFHRPDESYTISPYIESGDTLLYVVNFKEGWMILSRDRRTVPVIAENFEGSLEINPDSGYNVWLRLFNENLAVMKEDRSFGENDYTKLWNAILPRKSEKESNNRYGEWKWVIREGMFGEHTTVIDTIPQMVQTKWGQQAPWNNNYPIDLTDIYPNNTNNNKCYVGCVAVAIAQVLHYWHNQFGFPTQLSHTVSCSSTVYGPSTNIGFSRGDITNNSTRWDDMALSASSGGNTTYVGDLMLDIGKMANMVYAGYGSGAILSTALAAVAQYYGLGLYSSSSYSEAVVKDRLFNGYPVLISGQAIINSSIRHAWIINGFYIERQNYSMFRYCEYSCDWGPDDEVYDTLAEAQAVYGFSGPYDFKPFTRIIDNERFLMNWGEDGVGDGIFLCSGAWPCSAYGYNFSPYYTIEIGGFYNL